MPLKLSSKAASQVQILLHSEATNIVEMALEIGEDISTFFKDEDWSGLDLRTSGLEGVSFEGAIMDCVMVFDDQFDYITTTKPRSMNNAVVFNRTTTSGSGSTSFNETKVNHIAGPALSNMSPILFRSIEDCNRIMRKIATFDHAMKFYDQIIDSGIKPNRVTFKILAQKAPNIGASSVILKKMEHLELRPSRTILRKISSKSGTFGEKRNFVSEALNVGFHFKNNIFIDSLKSASGMTDILQVIDQMKALGYPMTSGIYTYAAKHSSKISDMMHIIAEMAKYGVGPSQKIYEIFAGNIKDLGQVNDLINSMRIMRVDPSEQTLKRLIRFASSFEEAIIILPSISSKHMDNPYFYNDLLNNSANLEVALAVIDEIDHRGVMLRDINVSRLLLLAKNNKKLLAGTLQSLRDRGVRLRTNVARKLNL